jgi:leucyl/phenylalanyl-tRNA--protein transferase
LLPYLDNFDPFPDPKLALDEPNGLLAAGANLDVKTLLRAYGQGIFPWYSEDEPILWWSPNPRGVLFLDEYQPSKSLRKFIRNTPLTVSKNCAFDKVVVACATVPRNDAGTWITQEMIDAYMRLHQAGHAHSIEVWDGERLVGGLYGVAVGRVFCGESMFHYVSNSSKLAFYALNRWLRENQFKLVDCQMQNPHLESMGVIELPRDTFLSYLSKYGGQDDSNFLCWKAEELDLG